MRAYRLDIKQTFGDMGEWNHVIFCKDKKHAIDSFYEILHGEYTKEWIRKEIYETESN